MRNAFLEALTELAGKDRNVVLLTADLGFGVFDEFSRKFPGQYFNVGVAEQNMTGIATGLALEGKTVFTYSIANFPTLRCLEHVRNDACYHDLNINIIASGGGFSYGALGMSHHATEDLSILRALPNVTAVAPASRWEARMAVRSLAGTGGVGYLRLDKTCAPDPEDENEDYMLGKARRIREGSDITLIASGGILKEALEAADILGKQGIACRVVSMHTVKPIDREEIEDAAANTGGIVTIEENTILGGLGGAVAEICLESPVRPRRFARIGLNDMYSSIVGSQEYLRERYGMDRKAIVDKVLRLIGE